ncbi:hypothetical protein AB0A73_22245 [Glycomyces sp. NPDC047369]
MSSADETKRNGTPEEADAAAEKCRRAVLELWNHQRTLRTGYPIQAGQLIRSVMNRAHRFGPVEQPPRSVRDLEQIHYSIMGMLSSGNVPLIEPADDHPQDPDLNELLKEWSIATPGSDSDITEKPETSNGSSSESSGQKNAVELLAEAYYVAAIGAAKDVRPVVEPLDSEADD